MPFNVGTGRKTRGGEAAVRHDARSINLLCGAAPINFSPCVLNERVTVAAAKGRALSRLPGWSMCRQSHEGFGLIKREVPVRGWASRGSVHCPVTFNSPPPAMLTPRSRVQGARMRSRSVSTRSPKTEKEALALGVVTFPCLALEGEVRRQTPARFKISEVQASGSSIVEEANLVVRHQSGKAT